MMKTIRFDVTPVGVGESADTPSRLDRDEAIQLADELTSATGVAHEVVEYYTDEETERLSAKWTTGDRVATVSMSHTVYVSQLKQH